MLKGWSLKHINNEKSSKNLFFDHFLDAIVAVSFNRNNLHIKIFLNLLIGLGRYDPDRHVERTRHQRDARQLMHEKK